MGTLSLKKNVSAAELVPVVSPAVANLTAHDFSTTETSRYLLFLPKNYSPNTAVHWPAILFLHGIGESGTNVWAAAKHGPVKFIEKHPDFPFILVAPQCAAGQKWSDQLVLKILDDVVSRYAVDTNRIYLTGLSMGGFGVWSLATTYPERFAAVAPVCGGGDTLGFIVCTSRGKGAALRNLPFWAFHGAKDAIVPVSESERMVAALKAHGCTNVKLTIYPQTDHDAWTETYNNAALYDWFLEYEKISPASPTNCGPRQ